DVEGVYTLDPRIEPDSKLLELISYDEMLELASSGAKVLHPRCVALAAKYKVPLLVKSTFNDHSGSLVSDHSIEDMPVTGISVKLQQSLFNMRLNSFDELLAVFKVFSNAVLDVISLISDEGGFYLGVTVGGSEMNGIKHILESRFSRHFELFHPVAVVTLVGIGMMHQRGIALHVLRSLNESSIDILAISTSEIKISCVVKEHEAVLASRVLHQSFGLGQ
ncbi:MAG: ACT domain-containing protein, partial [Deltaproteobacteria bacterium]|nr:ACT domain-containing protein [Deltaproteobacteria bacterium]